MRTDEAAAIFAELRPYLHGVAYRLTSSWADAEDVVADAWPRWSEWAETVDDPRSWLTRVVARLAVDHLRSARVRRESYTGPWLPEPVITAVGPSAEPDPLEQLVADESVRLAFLMVLDELPPSSVWRSCCTTRSASTSPGSRRCRLLSRCGPPARIARAPARQGCQPA